VSFLVYVMDYAKLEAPGRDYLALLSLGKAALPVAPVLGGMSILEPTHCIELA
jgi:hypothetical protein